jgi:hypothetical protein
MRPYGLKSNSSSVVESAKPAVEQALLTEGGPVLMVYPGLLARYDQSPLLEQLSNACVQRHAAPGFIEFIATDKQRRMPVLEGKPIPVILASEWTWIPTIWLENLHRSSGDGGIITETRC